MDIDAIRSDIPFLNECLYFNSGGVAPALSAVTDNLVSDFTEVSRHGPPRIMDLDADRARLDDTRRRIAALMGVDADDLCLTHGVSDGIAIVFNGLDWKPGDELIITDEEHPAVQIPADHLAASGIMVKELQLLNDRDMILQQFRDLLTPRTRLVTISHVTTDTGTRLPAEDITQVAHEHDIPVMFDGAQSLGQFPVHVPSIGADFYSFLNYKWLFGPYSAGGLYIEKSWQGRLRHMVPGSWHGQNDTQGNIPERADHFEAGPWRSPYTMRLPLPSIISGPSASQRSKRTPAAWPATCVLRYKQSPALHYIALNYRRWQPASSRSV